LDSEGNIVPLEHNEIVIRIKGEEKVRCKIKKADVESMVTNMVTQLKNVILNNNIQIRDTY
jgi:hypothetical protein